MPSATTTLPPDPTSARACRRFLVGALEQWGADEFADDAVLLLSELVTNAVLHAGTEIVVAVRLKTAARGRVLRIEVRDGNPRLPAVRRYSMLSGTGRGLALVDGTARKWAAEALPSGGKRVWFELAGAGDG
jgi:anti-sigma regulatory factor (Ser/Thr protein kinase)